MYILKKVIIPMKRSGNLSINYLTIKTLSANKKKCFRSVFRILYRIFSLRGWGKTFVQQVTQYLTIHV